VDKEHKVPKEVQEIPVLKEMLDHKVLKELKELREHKVLKEV
jgi:hypothetical protein